jgi:hypothetical protein
METRVEFYVADRGVLVKVVLQGKPEKGCVACSWAAVGATVGCLAHGFTRTQKREVEK